MPFCLFMKKKYRILKSQEFTRIISKRRFYATKGMVLYVDKAQQENCRIGITVKKKVGNAVVRNKCKRQIRAICDEIFNFKEKFDVVILIKEPFLENSYENNRKRLENLYKKVKID